MATLYPVLGESVSRFLIEIALIVALTRISTSPVLVRACYTDFRDGLMKISDVACAQRIAREGAGQ